MLSLPLWLTLYLSIGILFAFGCANSSAFLNSFRSSFRGKVGRNPGWAACTFVVVTLLVLWPALLMTAVKRVR